MPAEIIPFKFESGSASIRVVEIDGEPWFVVRDVLLALEYADDYHPARAVDRVPDQWKGVHRMHTLGGFQEMLIVSESGLYFFINRSDKPKALPFQLWLAGEVLPALRKRGYYGDLKQSERLRYHGTLARTVRQLETSHSAFSQNILLQQVQGICSILRIDMPTVSLLQQPADEIGIETKTTAQ